jgi:hypothetical protein
MAAEDIDSRPPGAMSQTEILLVLTLGLAFSAGVLLRIVPTNPFVHWRSLSVASAGLAFGGPLMVVGFVVWRLDAAAHATLSWLWLLAACNLFLQLLGILIDPRGIGLVQQILLSPSATSYFTDALQIHAIGPWLGHYSGADLSLHSAYHPPGPIVVSWL